MTSLPVAHEPRALVRRAMLLETAIVVYNLLEGALSVGAGVLAGSVVLVGFGLDSAIEVSAGVVVVWHLMRSGSAEQPDWEARVAKFVGLTLIAIAAYVGIRAAYALVTNAEPSESYLGIAVTAASLVVMPLVSRLQAGFGTRFGCPALLADSRETLVCTYLSAATLLGLAANALFGWWWADPVAGLALVYFIGREGREIFSTGELLCVDE